MRLLPCILCFAPLIAFCEEVHVIDLSTTMRLAGARNLDIQIARQQLKEAKARHDAALEQFLPWLSPGVSVHNVNGIGQSTPSGFISDANYYAYSPGAGLAASADIGDALYETLAAKQQWAASAHALESRRQSSVLSAVEAYFDLARLAATASTAQEALEISRDYEKELREAVGLGIAFKGDELRVRAQGDRFDLELRQSAEQQRVAAARLAESLHLDALVELRAQASDLVPLNLVDTNAPLETLARDALHSRPEMKQSRALLAAAHEVKNGAVYGPMIPSLNARAFGGGLGGGPDSGPATFGGVADESASLTWRLGPGGLFDYPRIHVAQAQYEVVRLDGEKLRDQIVREVVESRTRVDSLRGQIAVARETLDAAGEALRLTQQRKQFGVGNVLENIQAQQDLARAKADYLTAVAEYNKAQYELTRALGNLP